MSRLSARSLRSPLGNVALGVFAVVTIGLAVFTLTRDPSPTQTASVQPPQVSQPLPTSSAPAPEPLRLAVLGDSIAGGSNEGGYGDDGWPSIVARNLGVVLTNRAEGGTGYTAASQPGTRPYPERVEEIVALNPDIVIVEGSRNDGDPAETQEAAATVLERLQVGLPDAEILVIGPIYSFAEKPSVSPVNEAVKKAAKGAGLTYVDAVAQGWFTGTAHDLIGSDEVHPTDAGHRYLADLIQPAVARLIEQDPTPSPAA